MSALDIDVLVVGGGPAGLYAAECLASRGISTLVCEEHARVGAPVHCTGILASESFDALGLPRDATLNTLTTAQFVSPSGLRIPYSTSDAAGGRDRSRRVRPGAGETGGGGRRRAAGRHAGLGRRDGACLRAGARGRALDQRAAAHHGLRRQLRVPAALRPRAAAKLPAHGAARARRPGAPATSSCISATTSRPAGSRGRCRSSGSRAPTSASA